jgi:hypothetical protein
LHAHLLTLPQLFGGGGGSKRSEPDLATDSSEQFNFDFSKARDTAATGSDSNREQLDAEKLDERSTSNGRKQRNAVPQRHTFGQRQVHNDAAADAAAGRPML